MTDRRLVPAGRDLEEVVRAACDAGLPAVQLREKDLSGRDLFHLAERLRAITARTRTQLFVNDRVDVAMTVGADGVHLGGGSMPLADVRPLVGAARRIGVSTHAPGEVPAGSDFAFFGPVWTTPAKASFGPPQGEVRLAAAVRAASVPMLAIGGVEAAHVRAVRAAGAHGVAVIRAIVASTDPAAATRALLRALAESA